jgi:Uma2 family endonuclease
MSTCHPSILNKRLITAIDRTNSPYEAFPKLRCILRNSSVVPDITVIHRDRIPSENIAIVGAPDWTIEILSPEQSTTKLIAKIQTCLQEGTQLGWLIDAAERAVLGLFPDTSMTLLKGGDLLPVLPEITLELTVEQMFSWLR